MVYLVIIDGSYRFVYDIERFIPCQVVGYFRTDVPLSLEMLVNLARVFNAK